MTTFIVHKISKTNNHKIAVATNLVFKGQLQKNIFQDVYVFHLGEKTKHPKMITFIIHKTPKTDNQNIAEETNLFMKQKNNIFQDVYVFNLREKTKHPNIITFIIHKKSLKQQ